MHSRRKVAPAILAGSRHEVVVAGEGAAITDVAETRREMARRAVDFSLLGACLVAAIGGPDRGLKCGGGGEVRGGRALLRVVCVASCL